jgi:hypothetical protein
LLCLYLWKRKLKNWIWIEAKKYELSRTFFLIVEHCPTAYSFLVTPLEYWWKTLNLLLIHVMWITSSPPSLSSWDKKGKEVDDFVCIVTTKCDFFAAIVWDHSK